MTALAGTWPLARLALRRDRILLPAWVIVLGGLPVSTASATAALYPTQGGRQGYIDELGRSALLVLFYGPRPSASLGALIFWRMATGMLIMAIIGVLVVVRHTRVEEEAGRRELVRSGAVGRYADLAAALLVVAVGGLAVALIIAFGMIAQRTPAGGSFAMGLAWAAAGITGGAIAAVSAQVTRSAATARGIGLAVVAISFALRGGGDGAIDQGHGPTWLAWAPPLGGGGSGRARGRGRGWGGCGRGAATRAPGGGCSGFCPCPPRRGRGPRRRSQTGATSAPGSCRPASGPPRGRDGYGRRRHWRGGCTGARWSPGRSAS